jgi:CBS-domain-containing membrane protein
MVNDGDATETASNQMKSEGNTLFQSRDFEGALQKYNEGLGINPENIAILSNRFVETPHGPLSN